MMQVTVVPIVPVCKGNNMSFDVLTFLESLFFPAQEDCHNSFAALPFELQEEYEERTAILEFDGGLTRKEAEMQALIELEERMKI